MTIKVYKGDLPAQIELGPVVAIDTETMGLNPRRDKLCLVQLSAGDGNAHLVQIDRTTFSAPRLKSLLEDRNVVKIFHYARFDVATLKQYLDVNVSPLYCTKIASRLARTYTDKHGLKDIVK